ncbi:hypothetical protein OROGR_007644 [Orobanche gracilis]
MENKQEDAYKCPSFSSYSSDRLVEIAVRVAAGRSNDAIQNGDDEDFQFALVRKDDKEVLVDESICDGQIERVFPVFDRDLLLNNNYGEESGGSKQSESRATAPLGKIFIEDREDRDGDNPVSCWSSEADALENIPEGTYCIWRPKAAEPPPSSLCKKSNSTGSASKRGKFRDLLRSNSEGKDSFVFLTPKNGENKLLEDLGGKAKGKVVKGGGSPSGAGFSRAPSAHEAMYVKNRAINERNKKKSYLPYKRDLVGFFVNANGLGKSFPRF